MPQLDVEPTHRVIRPKAEDYPQTGWKRVMGQREKKEAADEVLGKMRQQLEEMKTDDKILSQH